MHQKEIARSSIKIGKDPTCDVCKCNTNLHDFKQGLSDRLERRQGKCLSLIGAWGKGAVTVTGAKRNDCRRLHLADAEQ